MWARCLSPHHAPFDVKLSDFTLSVVRVLNLAVNSDEAVGTVDELTATFRVLCMEQAAVITLATLCLGDSCMLSHIATLFAVENVRNSDAAS